LRIQYPSPKKLTATIIAVAAAGLLIWGCAREIPYRVELGRRHHQIGQLWTFCILYYGPRHGDRFPRDIEELKWVPEYGAASKYWDRALSEIELTAPAASRDDPGDGDLVVFREKRADQRGIRAFHEVNGRYGFTEESSANSIGSLQPERKPVHPMYIGG
jgi:hypothetical protein